jgi:hypothetical protein
MTVYLFINNLNRALINIEILQAPVLGAVENNF